MAVLPAKAEEPKVQIGVKHKPDDCDRKAQHGDLVAVHYAGKLTDGTEFDNSYSRGEPIEFEVGVGQVIQGWDQGVVGMCVGEKRKLRIPPELGYGDAGAGPIPGGATLVFDVEMVSIKEGGSAGGAHFQGGDEYGGGDDAYGGAYGGHDQGGHYGHGHEDHYDD